jgi:hypothetical protein
MVLSKDLDLPDLVSHRLSYDGKIFDRRRPPSRNGN